MRNFCTIKAGDSFCSKYVTVIMQMGVSVAIIQVVFLQCIMHVTVSVVIIQVTLSFITV